MPEPVEKPFLAVLRSFWPRLRRVSLGVRSIVTFQGQLVLVRHRFHDRERWYLPGGAVDAGEDAAAAALREVREEAGIPEPSLRLVATHGVYLNRLGFWDDHVIVFCAEAQAPPNTLRLDLEIAEAGLFSGDALPALSPGTARRLLEHRAGAPRSGRW